VISFADDKIQSKYYGARQSIREFNEARNLESAAEFKDAYKLLTTNYAGLPDYTNRAEATGTRNPSILQGKSMGRRRNQNLLFSQNYNVERL
jgi:hypothetical protein